MKPSTYRRVVTMNVDGKSAVLSDDKMQAYEFKSVPGYEHTLVWVDPTTPNLRNGQGFVRYPASVVPGPGGTSLHFVTFPPSSFFAEPSFDNEAARREALVYDGEIWLELDDAKTVHLKKGDVVVQNGTRHAWRNKGTAPVTMLFFLNGAKRVTRDGYDAKNTTASGRPSCIVLEEVEPYESGHC